MLYTRLRLAVAFLFIIIGIVLHFKFGIGQAWYLYLSSLMLIIIHFKFGTVWAAFAKLNTGKIDEADHLLSEIKRPEWLTKQHKAYYHFTKGMIALQRKELQAGETHISKSIAIGLRNKNDNALATLNLAHICYKQNRISDVNKHLQKAKSFNSDDLMIKKNIEDMEKALNLGSKQANFKDN